MQRFVDVHSRRGELAEALGFRLGGGRGKVLFQLRNAPWPSASWLRQTVHAGTRPPLSTSRRRRSCRAPAAPRRPASRAGHPHSRRARRHRDRNADPAGPPTRSAPSRPTPQPADPVLPRLIDETKPKPNARRVPVFGQEQTADLARPDGPPASRCPRVRGGILRRRVASRITTPGSAFQRHSARSHGIEGVDDVGVLGVHDATLELERGG